MKSPRHRLLLALFFAASLAPGAFTPTMAKRGHNPFATPTAPQSGHWELVDQRDLGIDGELVALSPDGQRIAGIGPDLNLFCVWNVESGDPTCDEERQPVLADSITWAPDSSAVVHSLNVHIQLHDSDIFVNRTDSRSTSKLAPSFPPRSRASSAPTRRHPPTLQTVRAGSRSSRGRQSTTSSSPAPMAVRLTSASIKAAGIRTAVDSTGPPTTRSWCQTRSASGPCSSPSSVTPELRGWAR